MKTVILLVCILGWAAASPIGLIRIVSLADDGQWKPALDGSVLGSGAITWLGPDLDDGQWKPHLDNSLAGVSPLSSILLRRRRSLAVINPNALPVPLDDLPTAIAKQAHIIQQNTEGLRNILGGGIPLTLPADTPEVALGKQADAIAQETHKAINRLNGWSSIVAVNPHGLGVHALL